jgi:anhydro-N-acetylmuramic acid kinase
MSSLYIGLMSGTSLDGVDAVLAQIGDGRIHSLASHHIAMPEQLRQDLMRLQSAASNELENACLAANAIAGLYAQTVQQLLQQAGIAASAVAALGAHGQTVRHQPAQGYTLQLLNAALLAELTGIAVAYDFRSRDIAAGGQGAPLVPAFHAALFHAPDRIRGIVNIGGIANISVLQGTDSCSATGFDCGPGNVLMDGWCERHTGHRYDQDGAWAASGTRDEKLLEILMSHDYFGLPVPKSTGRDDFHLDWLDRCLNTLGHNLQPNDVQATLCELTALTIAQACLSAQTQDVYLCGGGAWNRTLCRAIERHLNQTAMLASTASLGVPVDQVEAFAWLAERTTSGKPGNLPAVTGARGPRVLGSLTR